MNNVLFVNKVIKIVFVELNVLMDKLVEVIFFYGLIFLVVMEFLGIIVGGGFVGIVGEFFSFKYGFFDDMVR